MNSSLVSIVFAISIYATSALYAQVKGNQLALEPGRPFVDVQFERLGDFQATEQSRLLFLRLRNNLRVPIVVRTAAFNPAKGRQPEGVVAFTWDEVPARVRDAWRVR